MSKTRLIATNLIKDLVRRGARVHVCSDLAEFFAEHVLLHVEGGRLLADVVDFVSLKWRHCLLERDDDLLQIVPLLRQLLHVTRTLDDTTVLLTLTTVFNIFLKQFSNESGTSLGVERGFGLDRGLEFGCLVSQRLELGLG
jgi:hypothetical protein